MVLYKSKFKQYWVVKYHFYELNLNVLFKFLITDIRLIQKKKIKSSKINK